MTAAKPSLADALAITDVARIVTSSEEPYTIVHTNAAWAKITGYKFHEVVGKPCTFLHGPETQRDKLQALHVALREKKPIETTLINYRRDGTPFLNRIKCELVAGGTHYVGTLEYVESEGLNVRPIEREPTEIERPPLTPCNYADHANYEPPTKRVARGKKMRLNEVLENTTDPIVLCSAEYPHAIIHPNQPWLEMCGYTLEEVEGLTNKILTGPETDQAVLADLLSCVRRKETSTQTLINYKAGGQRFINQVQTMPVYDENDDVAAFMSMLREVADDGAEDLDPASNPADRHLWTALQHQLDAAPKESGDHDAPCVEAARRLIVNHKAVLADVTSPVPSPTQPQLQRVSVRPYADQALRDVAKRLLGPLANGLLEERLAPNHPALADQQEAWAATSAFLYERLQTTPHETGRIADMSEAAGKAMRDVLGQVSLSACR